MSGIDDPDQCKAGKRPGKQQPVCTSARGRGTANVVELLHDRAGPRVLPAHFNW